MLDKMSLFRQMVRIRAFEDALLRLSQEGHLRGSLHLARGQEALPSGICAALSKSDYLTVTYRGHGYTLAKGCEMKLVLAEILGRESGLCGGYGGKMHLMDLSVGLLGANGIVGAGVPIAAGGALSSWIDGREDIAVTVFGDGAVNQGAVMETMNIAALMRLPLLLVCENNYYSEMTPLERSTSVTDLSSKAQGFGIRAFKVDGNNVDQVHSAATKAVEMVRSGTGPVFLEALTYRVCGHYQLDPGTSYRSAEEILDWQKKDPIDQNAKALRVSATTRKEIESEIADEVNAAVSWALTQPEPKANGLRDKVFK